MRNMLLRAVDAALFKRGVYSDVGNDYQAILHALGVVMIAGVAFGISLTGLEQTGSGGVDNERLANRLIGLWVTITTLLIGWITWVMLCYLLGSKLMRGGAGYRQLLRAIGICYGPAILILLMGVPRVGDIAPFVGLVWILIAGVAATHELQELDWLSSSLATLPGWILSFWVLPVAFFGSFIS